MCIAIFEMGWDKMDGRVGKVERERELDIEIDDNKRQENGMMTSNNIRTRPYYSPPPALSCMLYSP